MNHNIRLNIDKFVDVGNYRWTTDDTSDEIFEPVPGRMARRLFLTGLFVGCFWIASTWLVPNLLFQILLCTIGCLFPVFFFLLGMTIDHFGQARGPLLILRKDRSIVLPRISVTIKPDENTFAELAPDLGNTRNGGVVLMLRRGEEQWPVAYGGFLPWSKPSPLERLYEELEKRYPTPERFRSVEREMELARLKNHVRIFFRAILFVLGIGSIMMGGNGLNEFLGKHGELSVPAVFLGGMIVFGAVLLVFFVVMCLLAPIKMPYTEANTPHPNPLPGGEGNS